jgi:hypothetical protein
MSATPIELQDTIIGGGNNTKSRVSVVVVRLEFGASDSSRPSANLPTVKTRLESTHSRFLHTAS